MTRAVTNEQIIGKTKDSRYVIDSVMKTLEVLFSFREAPHKFNLSELEHLVGLPKNQVFRSLKSLEEFGLIRIDSSGSYRVTPLIFQIAFAAGSETSLEEVAIPVIEQLQEMTQETVNLNALVDGNSVIIAIRHSHHSLRLTSKLGQVSGLHAGASPKAMLAFMGNEEQEKVLSMLPFLQKYTHQTVTTPDELRRELQEIRVRGYSISDEDFEAGGRGVGVPIFDRNGKVIGGISCGGPVSRVSRDDIPELGYLTVQAGKRVSQLLGYMGPLGEPS